MDRGPPVPDSVSQFHSVHRTRYVKVRKYDPNVSAGFEDRDRVVGVDGLDYVVPGSLDHLSRIHADQKFILDDKDNGTHGLRMGHESPTSKCPYRSAVVVYEFRNRQSPSEAIAAPDASELERSWNAHFSRVDHACKARPRSGLGGTPFWSGAARPRVFGSMARARNAKLC